MNDYDEHPLGCDCVRCLREPREAHCAVCDVARVVLPGAGPDCEGCVRRAESALRVAHALECERQLVAATRALSPEEFRSYARRGLRDDVAAFRAAVPSDGDGDGDGDGDDEVPCG